MPLAPLTTLKIGGPARFFVKAHTPEDVVAAVKHARLNGLRLFVLGGGSNILVSDAGFDGLVVHIALKGIESSDLPVQNSESENPGDETQNPEDRGSTLVTVQAGEDWDEFVGYCVDRGLAGVECLSGIPGLVGGTPVQNVGAYGQDVSESITTVRCFDRQTCEIVDLSNEDCGFAYRTSIFNTTMRDRYIVLSVTFSLIKGGQPKISYKDLKDYFGGRKPTLAETRDAVLKIRAAKSMVIDPVDPNSQSAGSFFKNPVVSNEELKRIAAQLGVDSVPHFEAGGDKVKIPAAWLIERAGFRKGFSLGNAGISTNHSLAIVNRGGATAAEIIALKNMIAAEVERSVGVRLKPEPIFVGFIESDGG